MPRSRYENVDGLGRCLVLSIASDHVIKKIPVEKVGQGVCKHEGLTSDCRRCWHCGMSMGAVYVNRLFEPPRRTHS